MRLCRGEFSRCRFLAGINYDLIMAMLYRQVARAQIDAGAHPFLRRVLVLWPAWFWINEDGMALSYARENRVQ